jgi:hypothetical protein
LPVKEVAERIDTLSAVHGEELWVRQYGSHIVVFTEGELCGCRECLSAIDSVIESFYSVAGQGMVICFSCGNKRCPHAYSHKYLCTHSNEPDQNPALRPEYQNGNAAQ